ncbi:aprataxin and PNK-like factor [Tautogolabrus adspersus]
MSGFDLVPVDGGGPIHLPPGETLLGRGPFLRVSDRRVSRNHGLLENLNGQLRLKPTHFNPCFMQSSPADDPRPLHKGSWYPLRHGDFFSLLPGQFIYEVVAVGGEEEERTPRNSQMFEEEEEEKCPVSPQPDVEAPPPPPPIGQDREQTPPQEEIEAAAPSNQEEAEDLTKSLNKTESPPPTDRKADPGEVTPSKHKRRVLPAWMMAAGAASSSSPKVQSAVKKSKTSAAASSGAKRAAAKKASPAETSSPEEAELSAEERPKRRRKKKSSDEERAQSKTDVPLKRPVVQTKSNRSEVSDESDGFTMEVDEDERGGETTAADINITTPTSAVSQPEKEDRKLKNGGQTSKKGESVGSSSSSAPSKPGLRTPCPYGRDCYRKNPLHFQESSHPGDTDYEEEGEEEEEEGTDLPECPYGTDCYRKNPLHRKEFKHTKTPASMTRTRPKKPPADDEEDDYEYDNSFINDDSEEEEDEAGGDDSDYVPPVSDDSEKEDIRGLQSEAQAFLKKKK